MAQVGSASAFAYRSSSAGHVLANHSKPLSAGGGGGYTSTNPEIRRVSPTANGRTQIKLVYVVLEAQYQSALTQAVKNINSNRSNVCVEVVGYLLEELRDASNYAAFTKDMEDANVFIGSLIFIEELADKVSLHFWLLLQSFAGRIHLSSCTC